MALVTSNVPPLLPPVDGDASPAGKTTAASSPPSGGSRFCLGSDIFGCDGLDGWQRNACSVAASATCLLVGVLVFILVFGILLNSLLGD